jgi:AraC-like DNA-binding protein
MKLSTINPFMRYIALQPSVISSAPLSCSYDHRLFYVEEGFATLVFADKEIKLAPETLIFLPSGTPYYFNGNIRVIVVNFDFWREHCDKKETFTKSKDVLSFDKSLLLETVLPIEFCSPIVLNNAFEVDDKFKKCLVCNAYPTDLADAQSSALIKDILCYVVKRQQSNQNKLPEIVQNITLYIKHNYNKEINNDEIGKVFGYHSFYLNRVFKTCTGITIHQAIIKERIQIAKRLLVETDLPVIRVAIESGFCDQAQFSSTFRKHTNFTPLEYRKNRQI